MNKMHHVLLLITLLFFISNLTIAQVPNSFNFQSLARDLSGNRIPNKNIGLEFALVQQNPTGNVVYIETHKIETNTNGVYSVEIGKGIAQLGEIALLDWTKGPYFLRIALDETGGQNYRIVGTSELISVPYALYAENVGNDNDTDKWRDNQLGIYYTENTGIGTNKPLEKIAVMNGNVFVADAGKSMIMKSPDGNCWQLQLTNEGLPEWTPTNCPVASSEIASLSIEPQSLVFGLTENEKSFTVTNNGILDFNWELNFISDALNLSDTKGTLHPDSSKLISISLDRDKLKNGVNEFTIYFTTDIGLSEEINLIINTFDEEKMLVEGFVIDAVYDQINDVLITVFDEPKRLDIYNTTAETTTSFTLDKNPNCVAVSLDGKHIAVGHDGGVSYFDAVLKSFVKYYDVSIEVSDVEIPGNGYVYAMPQRSQWEHIRNINLETGLETKSTGPIPVRAGSVMKIHPSGDYIYGADKYINPGDIEKYDIRNGKLKTMYDSPYHGDYTFGGDIWISEDGTRIFAKSKNIFKSSENIEFDMYFNGKLEGENALQALDHTADKGLIALIDHFGLFADMANPDSFVKIYEEDQLNLLQKIRLPPFLVPDGQGGGKIFDSKGHFCYFNSDGSLLFVWVKANEGSTLLNDWGLVTLNIE